MNQKNVVLGATIGYGENEIRNFVLSFRNFNKNDDIVIFVGKNDTDAINFYKKHNVINIFITNNLISDTNINNKRFLLFHHYLKTRKYDKILMADVRDVVFQSNPFENLPNEDFLYLFEEDEKITINNEGYSVSWIKNIFGEEKIKDFNNKKLLCVGTVLGSYNNIILFLNEMKRIMLKTKEEKPKIYSNTYIDQGINYHIGYNLNHLFKGFKIKPCGDVVATIGLSLEHSPDKIKMVDGDLLYNDQKPPIIHQYDRSQELTDIFNKKFLEKEKNKKPILCVFVGYSPSIFDSPNDCFGSELVIKRITENLTRIYDVHVFGSSYRDLIYNKVNYHNSKQLNDFQKNNEIDVLLINRYIYYFLEHTVSAKKVFVLAQDTEFLPYWNNKIIENNGIDLIKKHDKDIDGYVALTQWHKNHLVHYYNLNPQKFHIIENGIEPTDFNENIEKIKNRFIWVSNPLRGLNNMLDIFPEIQERYPDASLVVLNNIDDSTKARIEKTPNVYYLGKKNNLETIKEFEKSEFWVYPTHFPETYCISALEAQMSECLCVTSDYAALSEVVSDRGVLISYNPSNGIDYTYKNSLLDELFKIMGNEKQKKEYILKGLNWAKNQTWDNRVDKWINLFKQDKKEKQFFEKFGFFDLTKDVLNKIDLKHPATIILDDEFRGYFLGPAGVEHYRLLTYLSNSLNNKIIVDVGTNRGLSALSLSQNPRNTVYSFNIDNYVDLKKTNENVIYILDDIMKEDYKRILQNAELILVDCFHDGDFEIKFHKYLQSIGFMGLLVLDDIHLNNEMEKYWSWIEEFKIDVTHLGHSTGTGMVSFKSNEKKNSKIYDCFIFFNELDLLEIRLNYLDGIVDYFVLVEADKTHSGKLKPYYYEENKKRFKNFNHKIIHIKKEQDTTGLDLENSKNYNPKHSHWLLEYKQRDAILEGIHNAATEKDIIIISDVDEIPSVEAIKFYIENSKENPHCLIQKNHYYYLNCRAVRGYDDEWIGSVILTKKNLLTPQQIRDNRWDFDKISNGGWHFSYLGGADSIIEKIKSFAHSEYNNEYFTNKENINKKIEEGSDVFDRKNHQKEYIDIIKHQNEYPEFLIKNIEKYSKYIKKEKQKDMIDVVIPTMLYTNEKVFNYTLNELVESEVVNKIIIIDNTENNDFDKHYKINDKFLVLKPKGNIFVNPAWNLGLEHVKSKYYIILNDDILFEKEILPFCLKVFNEKEELRILTINSLEISPENNVYDFETNLIHHKERVKLLSGFTLKEATWRCGHFIMGKKDEWIRIPDDLLIYYGDDFIFDMTHNKFENKKNYIINEPYITHYNQSTLDRLYNEIDIKKTPYEERNIYHGKIKKLVFHVLGINYTKTTKEFSPDPFTQQTRLICKMLTEAGHTVYHYGTEGSNPICTEHITVLSNKTYNKVYGHINWKKDYFLVEHTNEAIEEFNKNAIVEIEKRKSFNNFLLCTHGISHKPIADALEKMIIVEPDIGYMHTFASHRIFTTYTLMSYLYGKEDRSVDPNPNMYDAVIPHSFDIDDYEFSKEKDDYYFFIGRQTHLKGLEVAAKTVEEIGGKLIVAGQGTPTVKSDVIEFVGVVDMKKRSDLMSRAKATFVPTLYFEPFGMTAIESLFCGTPVITTDFGSFPEIIPHGRVGYRCRTLMEFVWAAKNIHNIKPEDCREYAVNNFSTERVVKMFIHYFKNLYELYWSPEGWYSYSPQIDNLDWLVKK